MRDFRLGTHENQDPLEERYETAEQADQFLTRMVSENEAG